MLDLKFIRENTDRVRQAAEAKGMSVDIDGIIAADDRRHTLIHEGEALKARRNQVSAQVGKVKKVGGDAGSLIREMESVKDRIQAIDAEMKEVEKSLNGLMLSVPNIPHASVPLGNTPQENKEVFAWGEKPVSEEPMRPHWELTEKLGIIDFTRGAKVAGAGFPFYVGKGAVLERALINFFLDKAAEHGYRELWTPIVVNEESARGTGQLPDKEDLMYVAERDGLFLIPTAEVPVSNFHRDESFQEKDLPVRYAAYTPCFRREAGSYGKDVRGLNRLHQFDKVEIVRVEHPDNTGAALEEMLAHVQGLLEK